jgi:ribonuclease-3
MELAALEERLGYRFTTPALLEQAVTHRSHGAVHNERLEFLGDAVLNCTIAQLLYQKYARLNEGDLSRLRANLVKQSSLAEIAEHIDLSDFLRLGEGEMKSGGFRRPSILADTMEAIFGAVLVDGGFEAGSGVIARLFEPVLKHVDPKTLGKDSKTLLQEYLQGKRLPLPVYSVVETRGAAHNQEFEVECAIPKLEISVRGNGRSRRAAEQNAAKLALDQAHAVMTAARRAKKKSPTSSDGEPADAPVTPPQADPVQPGLPFLADKPSPVKPLTAARDVPADAAAPRSSGKTTESPAATEGSADRAAAVRSSS